MNNIGRPSTGSRDLTFWQTVLFILLFWGCVFLLLLPVLVFAHDAG